MSPYYASINKDGSAVTFFIDGRASPKQSYRTHFEFSDGFALGAEAASRTCSFLGVIDEVMVFNRVLSSEELKALYETQK